jgi:hypothetical protein
MIAECSQDLGTTSVQPRRMSTRISRPPVSESAALSPDRAFVVEFAAAGGAGADRLSGRVEHVLSGQATRFASTGELLEFVHGVLRSGGRTRKRRAVGKPR